MEAMPPIDYSQLATKQDVANLGIELRGDMALMEGRITNELASLRLEFGDLRSGMDRQFRQYFFANVALIVTLLGLVVGLG